MTARPFLDGAYEAALTQRGLGPVAGVDEVGRGPLAGPVFAAAVILDPGAIPEGLADSKVLSAARREALATWLHAHATVSIAEASVEEIDTLNILRASQLAMRRALIALPRAPGYALIDGSLLPPDLPCKAEAQVKGDARFAAIAAAAIVAKVARDARMVDLAQQFPGYGWEANAGYPTGAHRQALLDLGPTPHHRRSFKGVHNI